MYLLFSSFIVPILPIETIQKLTLHELPKFIMILNLWLFFKQILYDSCVVKVCLGLHSKSDCKKETVLQKIIVCFKDSILMQITAMKIQ